MTMHSRGPRRSVEVSELFYHTITKICAFRTCCARVHAYGAWCASDDKGRRCEGGVHAISVRCLVQGGETRDDEPAFTELARYG